MPRADFAFAYPKRVRFAEIDVQAVLFNSRYLEYFDIGLVEYLRAVGLFAKHDLTNGPEFHVARALVEYKAPILLDERIDICVRCARIGTTSLHFLFELHGAGTDDLRATGDEVHVHVAEVRGRPAPLPGWVIDAFETYERGPLRRERTAA